MWDDVHSFSGYLKMSLFNVFFPLLYTFFFLCLFWMVNVGEHSLKYRVELCKYEQFLESTQFHIYSIYIFIFHWSLEWTNQGHATLIIVRIWLVWLLLLLHHFELSEEEEKKNNIAQSKKFSTDYCRHFAVYISYIFCCYYVYSLFQMLSLKWRRCQYNVEYSSQHAAESELT